MDNYNFTKFRILLEKSPQEFKELLNTNPKEIYINLFEAIKKETIPEIIEFIKDDELHNNGYILDNLLLLEPLSLPIINSFIESGFLDEIDFIKRLEISRTLGLNILSNLQKLKMKIRNDKSISGISSDNLNNLLKEVDKHKNELESLKKQKEAKIELKNLQEEIQNIKKELAVSNQKELEEQLKFYKLKKEEIDKIKKEIELSKQIFKTLPKDNL